MRSHVLLSLISSLLLVACVQAGTFSSQFVNSLTASNFKEKVLGSSRATVAAFYAPWCGHCQRLAPEYEKAAKNLAGLVDFVAVDCDEDKNKPLCQEYGVRGFPTIKIFGGISKATPVDYNGERTASALVKHATREMPSFAKRLKTPTELEKVISKVPKKPIVFLVTDKIATSTLYKALSAEWQKHFTFYTIKDDPSFGPLKESFGISKIPSLILWKGAESMEVYGGSLKIGHINAWLKQALKTAARAAKEAGSSNGAKDEL